MLEQKLALLFPGQGAQKKGMGLELYQNSPYAKQVFDNADAIAKKAGFKFLITDVCFNDPKNQLTGDNADTSIIQPALLTYCVATYEHLRKTGMTEPDILLGQSAGKYSALVASEALSLEEAIPYVNRRGVIMKEAMNDLQSIAVIVIGLEYQRLQVELANLQKEWRIPDTGIFYELTGVNTRLQSMTAGPRDRLGDLITALKQRGAKIVQEYKESPPSHWSKLIHAQEQLNEIALNLKRPKIKMLDDLTSTVMDGVEPIEISISTHLIGRHLWIANMRYLKDQDYKKAVEVGPGTMLKNMAQREYPELLVSTTDSWKNIEETRDSLLAAA